jgi:hypothetical protein
MIVITAAKASCNSVVDAVGVYSIHCKVRTNLGFRRERFVGYSRLLRSICLVHYRQDYLKDFSFLMVPGLKSYFIDLEAFDLIYQVVDFRLRDC